MPRTPRNAVSIVAARPRGRPRKTALPLTRFAPIRLADANDPRPDAAPFACAFEMLFPDGLVLRAAGGVDPVVLGRLAQHLRGRGE